MSHIWSLNKYEFNAVKKIIQVIDSIPWVRCASGNVFSQDNFFSWDYFFSRDNFGGYFEIWLTFWNLVKIPKLGQNSEFWWKFWNLVEILKFGGNPEIWWKFLNMVEILKFGGNSEIWWKFWNLVENETTFSHKIAFSQETTFSHKISCSHLHFQIAWDCSIGIIS